MQNLTLYQVDAFTSKVFGGNPAGVCVLDNWLPEQLMQKIAAENNLAETAFLVRNGANYEIRWFTPRVEVDLCGHATLASAHVLFNHLDHQEEVLHFQSRNRGMLSVSKSDDLLTLDFPSDKIKSVVAPEWLLEPFGIPPLEVFKGISDYLMIYASQQDIESISPDFGMLAKTDARGVIVSAPGDDTDFISRFFAPAVGINEDPVTGSAHTTLIPYWAKRLNKTKMTAQQLSERKGELFCEFLGERVKISGNAVTYLVGEIFV